MKKSFEVKKAYWIVLFCVLTIALTTQIIQNSLLFVYNHPHTNTDVFSNIKPAIKHLDFILTKTRSYMGNDEKYKISYIYKNYYGSGFLKNNPIPNDLDSSIGVYLGEYVYNGKNIDEITIAVLSKISIFLTAFSEALTNYSSTGLVSALSPIDTFEMDYQANDSDKKAFQIAINNARTNNEQYILTLEKSPIDDDTIKVKLPYVMNADEILIENQKPYILYSDLVSYFPNMEKYMREYTVIFDFFIDIKDEQTGKLKRFLLVPEAFLGERLQYSRRMFVPNTFAGIESYNYLKNTKFFTNNDIYLSNRIYNFERYIQVFEYNLKRDLLHVKMLKRLHQAVDAFYPLLSAQERLDYYSVINGYLENEYVGNLNNLTNVITTLGRISQTKSVFNYYKQNNQISLMSAYYDKNLHNLKKSNKFDNIQIKTLEQIKNGIVEKMLSVHNDEQYQEMAVYVHKNKSDFYNTTKLMYPLIIDKDELIRIDEALKQKFINAGYKRLKIYWLNEQTIGVLKCNEIKNVSEDAFKKGAVESGLPNVNYKFITQDDIKNKIYIESFVWVRLNTTTRENESFERIKKELLRDKKNYKIKTKLILK